MQKKGLPFIDFLSIALLVLIDLFLISKQWKSKN